MLPLDGMRGIAAVGVTAFHADPVSPFLFWAWSFVDMFFVLSGFLIGTILQRGIAEGTLSLRNFWMRRILRIWPVYYLMLAGVVIWALISPTLGLSSKDLTLSLVFLQFSDAYLYPAADWNNMVWHFLPWFSHSWSIAVEEQFYLLLPLLLWIVGAGPRGIFLLVGAALVLSQYLLKADFVPYLLGTRMQGLALGLLLVPLSQWLAQTDDRGRTYRSSALMILLAGLLAGLSLVSPHITRIFPKLWNGAVVDTELFENLVQVGALGMSLIYFAVVGFVIAFPRGLLARLLSARLLVYLGGISYALYMFHVPIEGVFVTLRGRLLADDSLWINLLYWILVLACAALSKVVIEDRVNAFKDRYPVFIKSA